MNKGIEPKSMSNMRKQTPSKDYGGAGTLLEEKES
jgi:hypothetical protein